MNGLRINVLALATLGALLVITLAVMIPEQADLVVAIAGALIGGFAAVMRDLVQPDPNPAVPESALRVMAEMMQAGR